MNKTGFYYKIIIIAMITAGRKLVLVIRFLFRPVVNMVCKYIVQESFWRDA